MNWEDPQVEINRRVEMFFGRETDVYNDYNVDSEDDVRWNNYNEGYEEEFDWELYGCLIGRD